MSQAITHPFTKVRVGYCAYATQRPTICPDCLRMISVHTLVPEANEDTGKTDGWSYRCNDSLVTILNDFECYNCHAVLNDSKETCDECGHTGPCEHEGNVERISIDDYICRDCNQHV